MAGFDNDVVYGTNVDFTGTTPVLPRVLNPGELLIGSSIAPRIRVATLTAGANITITNGDGTIQIDATGGGAGTMTGLVPDAATAPGTNPVLPNGGGNIIITGGQIAASALANVIRTNSLAANTMTIEIQRSTTAAVSTPADNGVSHFDNTIFTVGVGGFVSLVGGSVPPAQKFDIDIATGAGTDPVVPSALGVVTITGGQVATGTTANVIRTHSTAANSYTIEVQRSTTAAASTVALNGVSHYDDTIFTVGADGFVSLVGGAVPPAQKFTVDAVLFPGVNPVVPDATGNITFSGTQVTAGTVATGIRTRSIAPNSMRVEAQISQAVAGSDPTKNGISHFNSAQFTVDANGFVSSTGGGGTGAWQFIETKTSAATFLTFNTSLSTFTELMFVWNPLGNSTVVGLEFNASADNGATLISGINNAGSLPNTSFIAAVAGPNQSGYLLIENTPGTLSRIAQGLSMASGGGGSLQAFNILSGSAKINWIKFFPTGASGTFGGDITVYGR